MVLQFHGIPEWIAPAGAGPGRGSSRQRQANFQTSGYNTRQISKKTVAKLMKLNSIRPPRRKRRMPMTTDGRHPYGIAPNLLDRNFKIATPDTVWLADVSYIRTNEGWL